MSAHQHDSDTDCLLDDFLASVDVDQLRDAASLLRDGMGCEIGEKIVGGYNILFELVFSDGQIWMARCPLPYNCSSQDTADKIMESYAATLKYLKLHSSIPVPEVFACCRKEEEGNEVGTSYLMMERLSGHPINMQEVMKWEDEYQPARAGAKKVFTQLANIVMQLASLQFDKIGSLLEQPAGSGIFLVGEYFDAGISFPPERGGIYEASPSRGPFSAVSEFQSAIIEVNERYAAVDEDEDEDYKRSVSLSRLLRPILTLPEYERGPFVLHHDDLSSSNILIDDEYNITGILDFPGTTAPLPSLCVYPMIFTENCVTPFTNRELWLEAMLSAQCVPGSALNDGGERRRLMQGAKDRGRFNLALLQTWAYVSIASLAEDYGVEVPTAGNSADP